MELGDQVVRDLKRCVQVQEELKGDILNISTQIALENLHLSLLKKDGQNLSSELSDRQEAIKSLNEQEKFLQSTRDALRKAVQWRSYFKKFVANMPPNDEHLKEMFLDMQNRYSTLIERYEQKPEYRQIIEAETTTRQLADVIGEKRNELMKLETQREY